MALFNRDYDRNYSDRSHGYRGGPRGYDRETGGGTWKSMKRNTREFFGMDDRYDRDLGRSYDRGYNTTYNRSPMAGGYDRGYSSTPGYGTDYAGRGATGGYDRPYRGYDTARYGRDYKSREQTDAGDPFGDRQSGTPMRVMDEPRDRGGWFGGGRGYDRDYDRGFRYDRNFGAERAGYGGDYRGANPMGYDPYAGNEARRGYDSGFRRRGYERDWF